MIAIGMMNIAGSCTSCYLTSGSLRNLLRCLLCTIGVEYFESIAKPSQQTEVVSLMISFAMNAGPFSRTAVNFNAGCKSAVSNIVMATAVMITLLFLTPLFHYTPLVVLSSIIITAMIGLIDYEAAFHLWKLDKFDFVVCISSYIGVVFGSIEIGLVTAVTLSLLRVLISIARPRTFALGNIPNSTIYRSIDQYPNATKIPGVLVLQIDAPIYFANSNYLRERYGILAPRTRLTFRCRRSQNQMLHYKYQYTRAITTAGFRGGSMKKWKPSLKLRYNMSYWIWVVCLRIITLPLRGVQISV